MFQRLKRVPGKEAWVGGVCGGVAYWLGWSTWIVRLVWTFASFSYGAGIILYILLWIFMPEWKTVPEDYNQVTNS